MTEYVYFLGDVQSVKIGKTRNLAGRFSNIRTSSPVELKVLVTIKCVSMSKTEQFLHKFFAPLRFRGEWFHRTGSLASLIANLRLIEDPTDLDLGIAIGRLSERQQHKPEAFYWHRLRAINWALRKVGFDVNNPDFIARNNEFLDQLASEHPSIYKVSVAVSNGYLARYQDVPYLPHPEYNQIDVREPDERILEINNTR